MDREHMYKINTVVDLDTWARQNGLSFEDDTELNLRRITLMAEGITKSQGHTCEWCGKLFKQRSHLLRHIRTMHGNPLNLQCPHCQQKFKRQDNLRRHLQMHKENIAPKKDIPEETILSQQGSTNDQIQRKRSLDEDAIQSTVKRRKCDSSVIKKPCNWCGKTKPLLPGKKFCAECNQHGRECKWCHRPLPERYYGSRTDVCVSCVTRRDKWKSRQQQGGGSSALNGTAQTVSLEPTSGNIFDVLQFFKDNNRDIEQILRDRMQNVNGMKWFITLYIKFVKYDQNNEAVYAEPTFRSITLTCTNLSQTEDQISEAFQHLHNSFQNFERDGSGWSIDKIIKMEISTMEYKPLEGSTYIPLPPKIQKKKAVLNIKNDDQKCFLWSVLASAHPVARSDHPDRVSHYSQYEQDLNTQDLEFPIPLAQIPKFEKQNDMSVNVFGLEGGEVFPLQITNHRNMSKHVNLLLFSKGLERRHFCLIRNMSRLLGDRTSHDGQTFYCNYCMHGFTTKYLLEEHIPYCSPHGPQKLSFPKKEEQQWLYFNHIQKQLKVPFVIYADFESFIKPIQSCDPNPTLSSTTRFQKHEPCGFSYMVKCSSDELSKPARVYRGPNIVDTFFDFLLQEEEHICEILNQVYPMTLTPQEEDAFHTAVTCHICHSDLGNDRVRDHDHLSGKYRGAAHNYCNLQFQFKQGKRSQTPNFYIPVVFHNLRGYDMHLLMESAGKYKNKPISCIPNNMEKYLSFSLGNLRFIDSLQFLNASLDTLVSNLAKEGIDQFPNLAKHFPKPSHQKVLLRKGVYCYSYVSSPETFNETCLPPKHQFYNDLNESELSDEDYEHAQRVWEMFDMTTFGQYHDLYLLTDVVLLADVFEHFREVCLDSYQLDCCHYYTAPGFSWEAMLKMTGVRLQLLDDINMVNMIENGVRGGICIISKKYAEANNPGIETYNPSKPSTWLTYLDMNNLYGTAMCEPLPEKDFEWLNEQEIEQLDITCVTDDAKTGYILECDLVYPTDLHDSHDEYPLAPTSLTITDDLLSDHSKNLKKSLGIKGKSAKKLVPNLLPKTHYVVHYRNLKYYLSKGLQMTKLHRALSFTQSRWLKPYIDFNTEKRKHASNSFEKDLFKLYNNSIFGKTIENMRKRVNVELVNTPKRLRKVCAKPNFQSFKIFNEDLVAVHMKKVNIVLNRPIYAGFCILDVSKIFMYQFHYDFIKTKYGEKAQLLFTDTDSLCYIIETKNWYQDMLEHKDLFDTSNFDKDHPLFSNTNSKVLGKFKDECGGKTIEQFVGLRPKMYSLKYEGVESKKAKGIKKCVVDKQLRHEMYLNCLKTYSSMRNSMNLIQSFDHQLYSIRVNKVSLSPYDDKRYFTGTDSFAYGNYKITQT